VFWSSSLENVAVVACGAIEGEGEECSGFPLLSMASTVVGCLIFKDVSGSVPSPLSASLFDMASPETLLASLRRRAF